jgi:hypothetical protein
MNEQVFFFHIFDVVLKILTLFGFELMLLNSRKPRKSKLDKVVSPMDDFVSVKIK